MRRRLSVLLSLLIVSSAAAQTADSTALARRAAQLAAMIGGADLQFDTVFNATLLAQVPPTQLRALAKQLASLGAIQNIVMTSRPAPGAPPGSAVFALTTDRGFTIPTTVVLEPAPPNLIAGLLFGPPTRQVASLDEAMREFRGLPGHASLLVARLDGSRLVPIIAEDTGRAMAIGSAFKLYVLAELTREIEAGQRHWTDTVRIDSLSKSLPSGILQTWAVGTPITLQQLATYMISISDNTAADHLLHILGRSKVEAVQGLTGNTNPALNEPFLSTREMFVLKNPDRATQLQEYLAGGVSERRAVLASSEVTSRQRRGPDFSHGPVAIDKVEWFATTPDLARVMIWLRDHSASGPGATTRDILTVNKGIAWPPTEWSYAAFKGGSEPGVLNLTFLAQHNDGVWYAFVATWNDSAKDVDENEFVALVTSIRDLAVSRGRSP